MLSAKYPSLDLSMVVHLFEFFKRMYADCIGDPTSLKTCFRTNSAYDGLTHPMTKTEDGKFMPDFTSRYVVEDTLCGLVPVRGLAELCGVATPNIDILVSWAQKVMGKEVLVGGVGGTLTGKDLGDSRCPQAYGWTELGRFMEEMGYVSGAGGAAGTSTTATGAGSSM
jgi:hypothetical protein